MGVLADFRISVAADLAPGPTDDWNVQDGPVDAIEPPAYLLVWSDPWLVPATHCYQTARLDVVAVAARVDVEGGHDQLERLVEYAYFVLDGTGAPVLATSRPGPFDIGGVTYLAARLTVTHPVAL